jgi:hypothetical protein
MLNEEKLDLIVSQLVENIESRITFYSDEDREFFVENVVNIILLSEQDQVEYNLYCFLEHNYENHTSLQHNLNEGIGSFVKGIAKGVGRMLGFGKPAEKIAFGAPPTTTISAPVSKDRDGKDGKGGGKGGEGDGSGKGKKGSGKSTHERYIELAKAIKGGDMSFDFTGVGAQGNVEVGRTTNTIKTGDVMSGNAAKAGRDLTQQDVSGNAQAQAGNTEDNRQQSTTSTAGDSNTQSVVAQPNTQGQKAAAQARTRQSMSKAAFIERHGEEEGLKRHAAHREVRRGQAANQRASARAAAANQATQTTKQTATTDTKGAAGGDSKVGNVNFGSGPEGHTMGDGGRTTSTTSTTTPAPAKPEPKSKGRTKKSTKVVATESVEVTDLYSDYMNRFLKG